MSFKAELTKLHEDKKGQAAQAAGVLLGFGIAAYVINLIFTNLGLTAGLYGTFLTIILPLIIFMIGIGIAFRYMSF